MVALVLLWVRGNRRGRGPLAAFLLFILLLAPTLGFIDFGFMRLSFVADRFQYLASIGPIALFAAAGVGFQRSARNLPIRPVSFSAAGALILFTLGAMTWMQCRVYKDEQTLFLDTIGKNPKAWHAWYNVAWDYSLRGENEKAIEHYEKVLELKPDDVRTVNNMGLAYIQLNRLDEAEKNFRRALEIDPKYAEALGNLGLLRFQRKDWNGAIRYYTQALAIKPGDPRALNNMGLSRLQQGFPDQAEEYFRQAIAIKPDHASALNHLGVALAQQGKLKDAIEYFQQAVEAQPDDPQIQTNLGQALLSDGRAAEAAQHFEKALALNPQYRAAQVGLEQARRGR
jgi:Tfp pilus assembly protein PilF